jgi:hypothetical protein
MKEIRVKLDARLSVNMIERVYGMEPSADIYNKHGLPDLVGIIGF